jgi:hypothetical protein
MRSNHGAVRSLYPKAHMVFVYMIGSDFMLIELD